MKNKNKTNVKKSKSKFSNPNKRKNPNILTNSKEKEKNNRDDSRTGLRKINLTINNKNILNDNIIIYKNDKEKEKGKENNLKKIIIYKNCELDYLNFKDSLKYDKRTFFQYYFSLLKAKNLILFSFYPINDYNLKIIKMLLFFIFFDIFFAINTLFFDESTIHQIYKDKGEYNFDYFLPQIIYSFIISYFIITIIKFFSLSERQLLQLRFEKNTTKALDKGEKVKKFLIIKYLIFFVLCFLFLILFWFYLSSFCAVYKNSQIYVIKNTFISFAIALFFPFIIIFLPSIFRYYSLTKRSKCIYKISKILQLA